MKNNEKAQEVTALLKDNLELQNFLQNCKEVRPTDGVLLRFQSKALRGRRPKDSCLRNGGITGAGGLGYLARYSLKSFCFTVLFYPLPLSLKSSLIRPV